MSARLEKDIFVKTHLHTSSIVVKIPRVKDMCSIKTSGWKGNTNMLFIWVEIYLRTGELRWRFDPEYKHGRMHGDIHRHRGGNDGQTDL